MLRPCFIVIDREFAGSISTRKLVIETAKFNVITAYSSEEAIATLEKFPNVDGVVLDAGMQDISAAELAQALKQIRPTIPIIAVCTPNASNCDVGDHLLESFDPVRLVALLKKLFPEQTRTVDQREVQLEQAKLQQARDEQAKDQQAKDNQPKNQQPKDE